MPRVFNHIEDYLDIHNKVNDLHIGGEITSGDKGIIYSISNDSTKVIKLMVIGTEDMFEITEKEFNNEVKMNELAFEKGLGVELYASGLFKMLKKSSNEETTFCYFITRKLDKTISDVLEHLFLRSSEGKIAKLNNLMNDLYNRQVSKCFLHGDLTHLGNIMLDRLENKLYFIDLSGSKLSCKLTDINSQWDTLKKNILGDNSSYDDEVGKNEIVNAIFPTKRSQSRRRSRSRGRSQSRSRSQSRKN